MGMFDYVTVEENTLNIPLGEYQTKDLNCGLDKYTIKGAGEFILDRAPVNDGLHWSGGGVPSKYPALLTDGTFTIDILPYDLNRNDEYYLRIENGKVTAFYDSDYAVNEDIEVDTSDLEWGVTDQPCKVTEVEGKDSNMWIHITEDDIGKREYIKTTLEGIFPEAEYTTTVTWQQTLKNLIEKQTHSNKEPDLIIMDMMFPRRLGGSIERDMGLTTYKDLLRRRFKSKVIFFSSEDQSNFLQENGHDIPCVVYRSGSTNRELTDALTCVGLLS